MKKITHMLSQVVKKLAAKVSGTAEWASSNVNCTNGCSHDCRYCYAKGMGIRFGRATVESWRDQKIRLHEVERKRSRRDGTIMFPSSHDITPQNLDACVGVLEKLLTVGNRVLIVSKPHLDCITVLCERLAKYRDQILFRFTIGSTDDSVLSYWEPGAPAFGERLAALQHAHGLGFKTSVSCEPMLDANIDAVVAAVRPFVTDAIWLGRANRLVPAVTFNCGGDASAIAKARELNAVWTDDAVSGLYARYKNDTHIKFKDSIKKVVGIAQAAEKGLDV